MTQRLLADKIGVTNAQMHRYETGATRIATSRLIKIADTLGVPVTNLIRGLPSRSLAQVAVMSELPLGGDLAELTKAFSAIEDVGQRRALLQLARSMVRVNGIAYDPA